MQSNTLLGFCCKSRNSRYFVKKILKFTNFAVISRKIGDISNKTDKMRIVSHRRLREFYDSAGHHDAKVPLERWYQIVEDAEWSNFADMRADFGSVDIVGNQHYVFNIGGNKYRLVVVVKFVMGYVFIRWVGSHSDYDKIDCSMI